MFVLVLQGLHVRMDLSTGKKEARLIKKDPPLASLSSSESLKPVVAHVQCGEGSGPCAATAVEAALAPSGAVALTEVPSGSASASSAADAQRPVGRRPRSAMAAAAAEAAAEMHAEAAGAAASATVDASAEEGLPEAESRMQSILMALPEPEPELASAIASGRRGSELAELLQRVWARRQAQLQEAMGSAKTEAQVMQGLLRQLLTVPAPALASSSTSSVSAGAPASKDGDVAVEDPRLALLADLEMHVAQLHNAEDFKGMGGITALVQLLNDTDVDVAAAAAWTLGTAVKYARPVQDAALGDGAAVMLVQALGRARATLQGVMAPLGHGGPPPAVRPAIVRASLALAARCVYAIGALARGHPQATAQLLALGFSSELSSLLAAVRAVTVPYARAAAVPGAASSGIVGGVGSSASALLHQRRMQQQQQQAQQHKHEHRHEHAAEQEQEPPFALDVPVGQHPALRSLNLPFPLPTADVEKHLRTGRSLCAKVVTLLADLALEHAEAIAEQADANAAAAAAASSSGGAMKASSSGHKATLTLLETAHGKPLAATPLGVETAHSGGEGAAAAAAAALSGGLHPEAHAVALEGSEHPGSRRLLSSVCTLLQDVRTAALGESFAASTAVQAQDSSSAETFCSLSAGVPGVTPLGTKLGAGSAVQTSNRVDAALTEALVAADATLAHACARV